MKLQELFEETLPYKIDQNGNFIWQKIGGDLTGAPEKVDGTFDAYTNKIESLKGGPKEVTGDFFVSDNYLTSLEHGPKIVKGSYFCSNNLLTDFTGSPEEIGDDFVCGGNKNESFKGAPKKVGGSVLAKESKHLVSFDGIPSANLIDLTDCGIRSLVGANKHFDCKSLILTRNWVEEGGLGLLLVKNLQYIKVGGVSSTDATYKKFAKAIDIINKYLGKGRSAMLECQDELEEARLEEFAKL